MRIYHVFSVTEDIYRITKSKPQNLYKIFEKIYLLSNDDIVLGYRMFEKLANNIDKNYLNKLIKSINKDNLNYTCFNNTHIINDFYTTESTKLFINNSHIKIKSSENYPSFFKDIKNIPNLFVCDFINIDYFYLKDINKRNTIPSHQI